MSDLKHLGYSVHVDHNGVFEVNRRMRRELTGVGPWLPTREKKFADGLPNPGPCERDPRTHKHYLFHC